MNASGHRTEPEAPVAAVGVLVDVLQGEWTPQRVLYLARGDEINALCDLLNALVACPHCGRAPGLSHLGTCPRSWMHSGCPTETAEPSTP